MLTQLQKLFLGRIPFTCLMPNTRTAFHAFFALPCLVDMELGGLKVAKPDLPALFALL